MVYYTVKTSDADSDLHWWWLLAERCRGWCQWVGTANGTAPWRLPHVWLRRQNTAKRRHCLNWRQWSGSTKILHKCRFGHVERLRRIVGLLSLKQSTAQTDQTQLLCCLMATLLNHHQPENHRHWHFTQYQMTHRFFGFVTMHVPDIQTDFSQDCILQ